MNDAIPASRESIDPNRDRFKNLKKILDTLDQVGVQTTEKGKKILIFGWPVTNSEDGNISQRAYLSGGTVDNKSYIAHTTTQYDRTTQKRRENVVVIHLTSGGMVGKSLLWTQIEEDAYPSLREIRNIIKNGQPIDPQILGEVLWRIQTTMDYSIKENQKANEERRVKEEGETKQRGATAAEQKNRENQERAAERARASQKVLDWMWP